jgi:FK506-binding protein 2
MMGKFIRSFLLLLWYRLAVNSLSVPEGRMTTHRRAFLLQSTVALLTPSAGVAAMTDETNTFANTWWSQEATKVIAPTADASDEITIRVSKEQIRQRRLGLELADLDFKTNLRVYVKSIQMGSLASEVGIQQNWVVIGLNGQSTERTNAEGVAMMLSQALNDKGDYVELRFRDPAVFRNKLQNLSPDESVTTQVAPAGDTTQRNQDGSVQKGRKVTSQDDQKVTVSQLIPPKMCTRGAQVDDLLEISYIGTVVETGAIFDGSAVKINGQGIPGRGDDVSLFFVLGKQPFGQFPPGWDVGLVGCCVGERRRLLIPPALAYGSKGLPRRGIPPDATLQYDVTLVSLNGLSTPQ